MKKILVFASGEGTNFEAIVEYFKNTDVKIELLCNVDDAGVLRRAKRLNIKSYLVRFAATYEFLKDKKYDLYVLAGYMRILPRGMLDFGKFVNIHPSLLPDFKGVDAIKRAFLSGKKETGVSVHYVNEEVDSGEIIAQQKCIIEPEMKLCDLEKKIHEIEHKLYPKVIKGLLC